MARRSKKVDFLEDLSAVTERMQDKDREVTLRRDQERSELSTVPLEDIRNREHDTRPLNEKHVQSLMESISVLGLIEPLAVDQEKVLLAGGHRLVAIQLMKKSDPEAFAQHFPDGSIPVRTMPFVASAEPTRALQIEIAENEQRRDYTPAEVRGIADRLISSGYKDVKGRPKKGEKTLMPALSIVVGKNRRTIQRYLHDPSPKSRTDVHLSSEPKKSRTDVHLFLKKAKSSLTSWQAEASEDTTSQQLAERLPEILALIEAVLNTESNASD
jgi:ParB family transcriptional regulator, chromosome partitioning protein